MCLCVTILGVYSCESETHFGRFCVFETATLMSRRWCRCRFVLIVFHCLLQCAIYNRFLLKSFRLCYSFQVVTSTTMSSAVSRRVVAGAEANLDALSGKLSAGLQICKNVAFIQSRLDYFEQLYRRQEEKNRGRRFEYGGPSFECHYVVGNRTN